MTHICVSNLTIIGSDNGLSPDRRQAIIWNNAGIFLTGPLGTNFSEISIDNHTFSLKKIDLKMSSGKWRPSCLRLNVLMTWILLHVLAFHPLERLRWSLAWISSLPMGLSPPYLFWWQLRWWVTTDVDVSVCDRSGLWPFRFVAFSVCGRSGLRPFRFLAFSVCGRFGCGRFGLWPLWPVTPLCPFIYNNNGAEGYSHLWCEKQH